MARTDPQDQWALRAHPVDPLLHRPASLEKEATPADQVYLDSLVTKVIPAATVPLACQDPQDQKE